MHIKIDPYLISSTSDVNKLTNSFFKETGLHYFQFCSVFNDDTSYFLVTHPDFAMGRVNAKRRILSHFDQTQIADQTYMFLWNESLPKEDTDMARDYGIDHGLCFVERFKNHYNLIAFAAPPGPTLNNFYLNNIGKLLNFTKEFKDKGAPILENAYEKRFKVPECHNDVNREILFLSEEQKIKTTFNGLTITLSGMEYKCLNLVASGFTMKGIATRLNISMRTVETYLNRAKSKTGLFKKQELAEFFHDKFSKASSS